MPACAGRGALHDQFRPIMALIMGAPGSQDPVNDDITCPEFDEKVDPADAAGGVTVQEDHGVAHLIGREWGTPVASR